MIKKLLLLLLLVAATSTSARAVYAQESSGGKIRSFLAALNQGDVSGALALTAPTFTLMLADGRSATGGATAPLLASLPTPITVISLNLANRAGHGTFQFGSSTPVQVDFTGRSGAIASMTIAGSVGSAQPSQGSTPSTGAAPAGTSYPAGWNLVALPPGTVVTGTEGPLYTLQAGEASYQTIQPSAGGISGYGYWAYFPVPSALPLAPGGAAYSVRAPAGQYIMIGDPSGTLPAQISGADIAYMYDPGSGYQATTRLAPGSGAFAVSVAGGTITVTPSANALSAPLSTATP
jgi:hypothetical protein